MRKLMWFTMGFGIACAVGSYLLFGNVLVALAVIAMLLAGLCSILGRRWQKLIPGVAICIGLAAGLLYFWAFDGGYLSPARDLDGVTTKATIEITDYSFQSKYGICADGNAQWQGNTYRIRLYCNTVGILNPGDIVTGSFEFRITNVGGADVPTYHRGNGIALIAYQRGDISVEREAPDWWYYPAAHIRSNLLQRIEDLFPEDTAAFAEALLLGEDSNLSYEVNTDLKVSGIRHIVAVSGLHVSILFGFLYTTAGKRKLGTALLGIPVLVLFAAVAGFTPSVVRAGMMHGLMMLAMLFNREYDPPTALAFSALAMLVGNPLVITSVSFQLSVGSMAGIFLFSPKIYGWLLDDKRLGHSQGKNPKAKLARAFAASVSVSLGAISLTTPLSAFYFGTVSLISPLSNLLCLWMVSIVFYGIMAVCALSFVWNWGAVALAWLVSWPIRCVLGIASVLADLPLAAVYTRSDTIVIWLVLCYLLLLLHRLVKGKYTLQFISAGVLSLCLALLMAWIPPMGDRMRMTVLDVGQGQSIILQTEGKTFLVDCGGDYDDTAADTAAETLLSMGISRIDGLILTHYDADHAGGAKYLLSRIQTDALFLPVWEAESETATGLAAWNSGTVHLLDSDMELSWENGRIRLLPSDIRDSGNESSMCVLFQAADCDILITGDRGSLGEKLLMKEFALPDLEILVVGHHGARDSACEELLELTSPEIAVISVGDNAYGHPNHETLNRLTEAGCKIFRTDEDGTVIIRR